MKYWSKIIHLNLLSLSPTYQSTKRKLIKLIFILSLTGLAWLAGYKCRDLDILKSKMHIGVLSSNSSQMQQIILDQNKDLISYNDALNSADWYRFLAIKHGQVIIPYGTKAIYLKTLTEEAQRYGIPLPIIYRLVWKESKYNPNALSNKGASGLMQMTPSTYKLFKSASKINESDPVLSNIKVGCYMLNYLYKKYDRWDLTLAAYNAGSIVNECKCVPNIEETQNYVKWILNYQKNNLD